VPRLNNELEGQAFRKIDKEILSFVEINPQFGTSFEI